ncbi:squalene/phytoene synthase family protein [Hyphococcus sp.]|uniref:squalene/phytoene synthase family protein n=1 Tax=Hyphococcus sp. TaxID=2038636 RepID=UPI003D096892
MSETSTQSLAHCSSLVRSQDEDRWLAAHYAAGPLQDALLALAALRIELRRIPSQVSEPPLGEIRLQWWREGLEAIQEGRPPRAHPVLEAAASTMLGEKRWAGELDSVIDACSRPLYGEGFSSAEDLSAWFVETDGRLDALGAAMGGGDDALAGAAAKAGAAFAMAREGRILAPRLAEEINAHALRIYKEAAPVVANAAGDAAPTLLHLSLTPLYLRKGDARAPLRKRLTLFAAMAFGRF